MIEEPAVVVRSSDGFAEIEIHRQAHCGTCAAGTGCGASLFSRFIGRKQTQMRVRNPIAAQAGDRVVVGLSERVLIKASLTLYIVPLVGLVVAGVAGKVAAQYWQIPAVDLVASISGIVGLVASLAWVKRSADRFGGDTRDFVAILRFQNATSLSAHRP